MGLKIAVVGCGQFSSSFIPLFQVHPWVEEVIVADKDPSRAKKAAKMFNIKRVMGTLDEVCTSDVDAVALFTQRHLHGPQTLQALQSGKHVYCAVPIASSVEDIRTITKKVKEAGLIYMSGETSYYYPSTIYCRDKFQKGEFGQFVYGESQYLHDLSHGFYEAFQYSGGKEWRQVAGIPPMYYPTHSVSMLISVTGAQVTNIACLGFVDEQKDGVYGKGSNLWDNSFSNETALARTSDGGMCRFNEFRRVGWSGKNSVYMSMFGTHGSYEEHGISPIWTSLSGDRKNVNDLLECASSVKVTKNNDLHKVLKSDFNRGYAFVHNTTRLPKSFKGQPNGHFGSHQFLVDDFVKAVTLNKLPPTHAWNAAKYCVPGIIAHESANKKGEMEEVPDLGGVPKGWDVLKPDEFVATSENVPFN